MIFNYLLLFVPVALAMKYLFHAPGLWVFFAGILAIVPLAEWIRRATENVAHRVGSALGGLLNVTFGNAAELILAIFVLLDGAQDVVKGQITGSIMGNSLLGLGLAALVGGFKQGRQKFDRQKAGTLSSLLILSSIALLLPALFDYTERGLFADRNRALLDQRLSLGVSVVLILVYAANLVYTLRTQHGTFDLPAEEAESDISPEAASHGQKDEHAEEAWPLKKSISVLLGATVATTFMAELVAGGLESAAAQLHVSEFFLGVIVLAVIGNFAEYVSAVYFARKNDMSMVTTITVGSTIQIALLTAPLLVLISFFLGKPMNLVFSNPLELIAIAGTAFIVNAIAQDGETSWFEGLLLIAVYIVFGIAFYFVAPPAG